MRRRKLCIECRLPLPACNAMAMYRFAANSLEQGHIAEAKAFATLAREWEKKFNESRNAASK